MSDFTGIGSIADLVKDGIDKIWPDPVQRAQAQAILDAGKFRELDQQFQLNIEQIKANAAQAAQPGFHFRDGAGWVGVIAFGLMALKTPIEWCAILLGHPVVLPSADTTVSTDMLFMLLGVGGMHVYQKVKGQ